MAEYKVPQDVEADDKLIGPFGFRQFIYLIIVALAMAMAWGLFQLFPLLVVIPLPIIIFFGALALPLRKDQPMEIYLAAMVSFYLKPRKRLWDPDGIDSLIEITAPKIAEVQRTKDISQGEARQRFGYLAEIVDSQGWAVRGQGVTAPNSAMNSDVYFEAQSAEDILDTNTNVSQSLDSMITKSDAKRHQEVIDRMREQAALQPEPAIAPAPNPYDFFASGQTFGTPPPPVDQPVPYAPVNDAQQAGPYQPTPTATAPSTTSENDVPPGIINLANNADGLSVQTIASEADRITKQNDEVVVSLR